MVIVYTPETTVRSREPEIRWSGELLVPIDGVSGGAAAGSNGVSTTTGQNVGGGEMCV